ncbi:META domain-containing protein [Vibrio salinus]|uniref:META domain-containing protein n=1 Tax=Vibrio salinus TaxID=2899784 RepID=UPI001E569216|nr:META domain-containing protein [Vibrio salinus]MCE0492637.1 META domain-containing protein [Vibrio salinus]
MKFGVKLFLSLSAVTLFTAGCTSSGSQKSRYSLNELQAQKWSLTQINGEKVSLPKGDSIPYIVIDKKMMAVGSAGCNHFFAQANIEKSKFRLDHLNKTHKVCEKDVTALENTFTDAIQKWNYININDNSLVLSVGKKSLTFTATN